MRLVGASAGAGDVNGNGNGDASGSVLSKHCQSYVFVMH